MSGQASLNLSRKSFVAILLVLVLTLFWHAWLTLRLSETGIDRSHAANLARLVTLPGLIFLVWLVVRKHRIFLRALFSPSELTKRLILTAIAIGFLARILAWAQITFRVSYGFSGSAGSGVHRTALFELNCPSAEVLLVAAVVWCLLVPFTEEFVHRGIIQSALRQFGAYICIPVTALIFALAHEPDGFVWVFVMGLILGTQYWNSGVIWFPMITHAVYDGLILIDVLCELFNWSPVLSGTKLHLPGIASAIVALACAVLISLLISKWWIRPKTNPIHLSRK